ncbi:MAG: NAD(P)-binding protein [Candidatus Omnitrophica bacterium]|nr:NAD(P)-binding protein [Candidatus Omnitrophota bacterium]
MFKKKIIILGAGLTGLSTAYHFRKYHIDTEIFEKEGKVGGLCRSKNINGFTFDYAGHLLHFKTSYVSKLVKSLLVGNLIKHIRNAGIFCYKRIIPYPFQTNLWALPYPILSKCLLGFLKTDNFYLNNNSISFLNWIYNTFGDGLAKYFMIPYNQKLWRFSLKKMSCSWVNSYIPKINTEDLIKGAIEKNKDYIGYNRVFWYPKKNGIESLISAFSILFKNINTFSEAIKIEPKNKKVYFKNGLVRKYDYLISTIPLVELLNLIEGVNYEVSLLSKKLKWTSVFNLNLGIKRDIIFKQHWLYFPENKYVFFRIGFPCNLSKHVVPEDMSSLYIEVSYPGFREIEEQRLISRIINDLKRIKIIKNKKDIVAMDANKIKYAYVVYTFEREKILDKIFRFLRYHNIYSIGRYGGWRYSTIEDCILEGKLITERILNNYA